jgi:hypothetical protein
VYSVLKLGQERSNKKVKSRIQLHASKSTVFIVHRASHSVTIPNCITEDSVMRSLGRCILYPDFMHR